MLKLCKQIQINNKKICNAVQVCLPWVKSWSDEGCRADQHRIIHHVPGWSDQRLPVGPAACSKSPLEGSNSCTNMWQTIRCTEEEGRIENWGLHTFTVIHFPHYWHWQTCWLTVCKYALKHKKLLLCITHTCLL